MGTTPGGMRDRWTSLQHRHDQLSRDIAKMRAAADRKRPRNEVDAVDMLHELATGIDQLTARQAAQDRRHAASREHGMAAYEAARRRLTAEVPEDRSPTVAASMGLGRPGVKVSRRPS